MPRKRKWKDGETTLNVKHTDPSRLTMAYAMREFVLQHPEWETLFIMVEILANKNLLGVDSILRMVPTFRATVTRLMREAQAKGWIVSEKAKWHGNHNVYSVTEEGKEQMRKWLFFLDDFMRRKYRHIRDERADIWNSVRPSGKTEGQPDFGVFTSPD